MQYITVYSQTVSKTIKENCYWTQSLWAWSQVRRRVRGKWEKLHSYAVYGIHKPFRKQTKRTVTDLRAFGPDLRLGGESEGSTLDPQPAMLIAELRAKRASGAPWVNKSTHPRKFGNHVTDRPTDRPSVRTTGIPIFTLTLCSYFGSPGESWLHINVVINWQLSKQGIRWPVSPDRIEGSGVDPSTSSIFEVIRWQFTLFQMIAGSRLLFLKIHIKYVVFMSVSPRTITILISNWPQTQKFSQFF